MPATQGMLPWRLFLLLTASASIASAAQAVSFTKTPPREPIHFQSDHLEYHESDQVIVASGNVVVRESSYTFQSDQATFDLAHNHLDATGLVHFQDVQGDHIRSRFLSY